MSMMMNLRRRYGGKVLPYDAEVEWLESDKKSLVDTGIDLFDVSDFEMRLRFEVTSFYNYVALWAESTDTYESWIYADKSLAVRINNYRVDRNIKLELGNIYNLIITGSNGNSLTLEVNGTTNTITRAFSAVNNLLLFGGYTNSGGAWKFYAMQLSKNGTKVRDFIPVRVGQVGYLYDKVSGQLFGNQGTGAFIVGPDVISGG